MSSERDELQEMLQRIVANPGTFHFTQLYALSDLAGERLAAFVEVWDNLEADHRRRLIHALVDLAEASFQVNFDAIYRYCLADPDPEIRATAISGLWENEELTLVGPLITALRADPAPEVRAAAAAGLGRFVLAGELEQIEDSIENRIMTELLNTIHLAGESKEVRRRALESVGYACTTDVAQVLDAAYDDQDEAMRRSAIVGMGRSCDRRWQAIVLTELHSTAAAMRYEAALAAGEMMLRPAVPILARLMSDTDVQVRDASIWALGQIGGDQSKRVLIEALEDADEETQTALEEALAEHALTEGELDFTLYEMEEDSDDDLFWDEEDSLDPLDALGVDDENW